VTPDPGRSGRPTLIERLRRHLRLEDVLLFLWVVLLAPLVLPATGSGPVFASGPDLLHGLLDLVALVGLAACIGARTEPGVEGGLFSTEGGIRWAVGPLSGAFLFALDDTMTKLGLDGSFATVIIIGMVVVAVLARWRLPPMAVQWRRTLVTPFLLATSGYFSGFLSGIADIFDLRPILHEVAADPGLVAFAVGIGTLGVLVFYVMLVFAPRQVAEREGSVLAWTARFLLFLVGLTVGTTWSAIAAGG
jgi:hypothetical protein